MMARQQRVARTLLLLTVAFVGYASVYPLELRRITGDWLPVLIYTWRTRMVYVLPGDIAANTVLYTPIGFLAFFSLPARYTAFARGLIAAAVGIALSVALEVTQFFEVDRVSSFIDVLANSIGTVSGVIAAAQLHNRPRLLERPASLFLLGTWSAATALTIFDRNAHLSIVGAIAAALLAVECITHGFSRVVAWAIALVLLASLCWRELEPFRFTAGSRPFVWIPFASSFVATRGSGLVVFLDKAFLYGTCVWFARTPAGSLPAATIVVSALLVLLEGMQTHLPGRIPEISDAVLAAGVGFVLYLLAGEPGAKKFTDR